MPFRAMTGRRTTLLVIAFLLCSPGVSHASELFVSNEVDNTVTVLDGDSYRIIATIPTDQRPRGIVETLDHKAVLVCDGDSSNIDVIDTKTLKVIRRINTGPDPETLAMSISGDKLYVSNENNALVTVIDYATGKWITQIQVGIEPEGLAVTKDGRTVVVVSEETSMAHFIDTRTWQVVANVLVDTRPRVAVYTPDQRYLWVSSEVGGTVSVIDPKSHQIAHVINFDIPGVDKQYILVGQRPWQLTFSPDRSKLYVANGLTNDVTIIDVASLKALKSVPVGRLPWGIAVVP